MKRITLLLSLLIGVTSFSFAHHHFEYLEGVYYNFHYHNKIVLKSYKHGLKVKGLAWKRGWTKFRAVHGSRFFDKRGNELLIRNHKVIIRNKWERKSLVFTRHHHHSRGNYYESFRGNPSRYKNSNKYHRNSGPTGNRLSGVWYNDRVGKALEIQLTNNGLRSRFIDAKQWVYYHQIGQYEYEDERGNRLRHQGSAELVWEDKRGDVIYYLYK